MSRRPKTDAIARAEAADTYGLQMDALADAFAEAIKEATEKSLLSGIPEGHLYAGTMNLVSFDLFNHLISRLIARGHVRRDPSYLLVWIGPSDWTPPAGGGA